MLIRRNSLLVLNLRLDIVDRIGRFNLEGDRLAGQGLDEDLHTSTKTEDEVEGGLLLNVAARNINVRVGWEYQHGLLIRKSSPVLELLASKDQPLLVRGDALLVLNLRLDVIDGIGRLDLESDRLAGQGLDKDLHAAAETQDFRGISIPRRHNSVGGVAHQGGEYSPSEYCY